MKIHTIVKDTSISAALREYAERKVLAIEHLGEEFEKSEIVLQVERHETICEVVLHPRRGTAFVATERAEDGRAAVDGASAKIERQVVKLKKKLSDQKRRATGS